MIVKPLCDVNKWPAWVILTFFVPRFFWMTKIMENISHALLFWFGRPTRRLGATLLDAVERGYLMRGWCEPLKDGGFILGVYSKRL